MVRYLRVIFTPGEPPTTGTVSSTSSLGGCQTGQREVRPQSCWRGKDTQGSDPPLVQAEPQPNPTQPPAAALMDGPAVLPCHLKQGVLKKPGFFFR